MPAEYYLSSRHTFVDAVSEPVQSRLTGDCWTNLARNQSNSFGLMLPRCARQTAFSETTPHYRIGLISEHLVQSQRAHSEQQMFGAVPRNGPPRDNKTTSLGISTRRNGTHRGILHMS